VHVKLPEVFWQVAWLEQLLVPAVHSFTSLQVTPLPVKPGKHAHWKPPGLFVHVAFALQFAVPCVHSLMSVHTVPLPLGSV
jgi:hypothetical protein